MSLSIKTTAGALAQALIATGRVSEDRNTIPALGKVMLTADGDGIRMDATDLDINLTIPLSGEVIAPGRALLDGSKRLRTMLCAVQPTDTAATVQQNGDLVVVTCGALRIEEDVCPADDFPAFAGLLHDAECLTTIHTTAQDLVAMLDAVAHSISDEETRYYLNGTCFIATGQDLVLVATDGHRLMSTSMPVLRRGAALEQAIVPKKVCAVLRKMLPLMPHDWPLDLTFAPTKPRVEISTGHWRLVAKCIDGTFPDWRRVLPKVDALQAPMAVHQGSALAVLLSALAAGRKESQPAWFRSVGGAAQIAVKDDRDAELTVTVDLPRDVAEWPGSRDAAFFAQIRYVADICRAMPGGFEMRPNFDPGGPIEIKAGASLGALMPMKGR